MSVIRNNSNRVRRVIKENLLVVRAYNRKTGKIEEVEMVLHTKATDRAIRKELEDGYRFLELVSEKTKSVEYSMTFSQFKKYAERTELIDGKEVTENE